MRFLPHVTVATIVEDNGRFLMVEEVSNNRVVFNQPAGHLEADESLIEAAYRETLEETAWTVEITGLTGMYLFRGDNGVTYQRTCFTARPLALQPDVQLDEGIVRAHWLTLEEITALRDQLRSPMVLECIIDYLNKPRYPLDLIR
ncbi:putative hydrolase [Pseudomonas saudimassiliensis]|uniref:Phosphatase NudJ n=1 Tax=Pseudomonas saudimassiliensis TaxID=1461581 RepID=A0A078MG01_9PSED|nr:NUDIX hydrolase [Pseudomonas saudimassiliensis]CEA05200.1 putative hydrolase [Pseudomonas saudimassiliensis]CEF27017.1 putative hydrolase [Pseudomonas saudimassiliensis]